MNSDTATSTRRTQRSTPPNQLSCIGTGLICFVVAGAAVAQPQVPIGFTIQQIAPLLDGQMPQLEAIDDPNYGAGVITAVADPTTNTVTFRLVDNSGIISAVGTKVFPTNVSPVFEVLRVRMPSEGQYNGLLHATIAWDMTSAPGEITTLLTIDSDGTITSQFESAVPGVSLDFDFGQTGGSDAIQVLDRDSRDGTLLGLFDADYALISTNSNSVPAGRTDTDVKGFRRDATGLYGGGILLADTDDLPDNLSAIYELHDVESGGTYRPIFGPVANSVVQYGDLGIAAAGAFGGVIYVTETLTDEIQQVAPDGSHTTWATGFSGIDSLSISTDGEFMYIADLSGIWMVRASGIEPGPTVLTTDPSVPAGSALVGPAVTSLRVIFDEPVSFTDGDVMITDSGGHPVAFDASASGSRFMIIGLVTPLESDTYTVTIADTVTSVATGQPLDGDADGTTGGDFTFSLTHATTSDCPGDLDGDNDTDVFDFGVFAADFGCTPE